MCKSGTSPTLNATSARTPARIILARLHEGQPRSKRHASLDCRPPARNSRPPPHTSPLRSTIINVTSISRKLLPAIWLCFLFRCWFYASMFPLWEGYDEFAHFGVLRAIVNSHTLLPPTDQPGPRDAIFPAPESAMGVLSTLGASEAVQRESEQE